MSTSKSPLTIAQLLLPAGLGGLERVVHQLSRELTQRGHRAVVGVLSPTGSAGDGYAKLLREDGISVESIWVRRRGYLAETRAVREWLRRLCPDVLHTHGYRPLVVDAPVGRRLGAATVATFHGFLGNSPLERLYEYLEVLAARRVARVIAVSRSIRRRLERSGVSPGRIAFIPNGLRERASFVEVEAARQVLGIEDGRFAFGWVGRLSREKGPDVVLHAHARMSAPRPLLVMVGDGVEGPALRALSAKLGTAGEVVWRGALPEADRYFRGFDAFVLSSRTEGAPMVVLEACHAGVPIVATRVGEVAELTGEDGAFLVEPERPEALAAAMEVVRASREQASTRAGRARARALGLFSATAWAERHVQLYFDAIRSCR